MPPPPTPFHLFRTHHAPVSALSFNPSNTLLLAGDQDGYVSVTDLRTRRVILYWQAHNEGVLGVEEWDNHLISHGRDNVIHLYEPIPRSRGHSLAGGPRPGGAGPPKWKSLPTNSLNFCRFSLVAIPGEGVKGKEKEALLAVPNLVDSELVDVYHLPSMKRIHAALNHSTEKLPEGGTRSGLVMSLHLRLVEREGKKHPMVGIGFEDGRIEVWENMGEGKTSEKQGDQQGWMRFSDGKGLVGPMLWKLRYSAKGHNEAVMAMTVDQAMTTAFTVSADHNLCRYDLSAIIGDSIDQTAAVKKYSTAQIGNASIALSPDEKVLAIGGWDGKIRLLSAATGKPLGTLEYHRDTLHVLAFPHARTANPEEETVDTITGGDDPTTAASATLELGDEFSDEDEVVEGVIPVLRWLASGGKDTRIALWGLMDFAG